MLGEKVLAPCGETCQETADASPSVLENQTAAAASKQSRVVQDEDLITLFLSSAEEPNLVQPARADVRRVADEDLLPLLLAWPEPLTPAEPVFLQPSVNSGPAAAAGCGLEQPPPSPLPESPDGSPMPDGASGEAAEASGAPSPPLTMAAATKAAPVGRVVGEAELVRLLLLLRSDPG